MTRAHRHWHFWAWLVLTPVVLGLLAAALVARPEAVP
jgi:hypothetical protein